MEVKPICADSLGVRSVCTLVKTKDVNILLDASAALGPSRYGLPPSKQEIEQLMKCKAKIHDIAKKCDIITISHYHYDHYDPEETLYFGKTVYVKDISENINKSQLNRGKEFYKRFKDKCKIIYADGKKFNIGNTHIEFSPAFPHGPEGTRLGYIIMTAITDGTYTFIHGSDCEGPVSERATKWIIGKKPNLVYLDGPPTVFLGWKFSHANLEKADENIVRIIRETGADIILDHHSHRVKDYKKYLPKTYATGKVKTAAEFLGLKNNFLEAMRKELWQK